MSAPLEQLAQEALAFAEASAADSTKRAYASDMRHFTAWCAHNRLTSVPAEPSTVALYITSLANDQHRKTSTIQRRLSSIAKFHELKGHPDPTDSEHVTRIWKGMRRTLGVKPNQKQALIEPKLHQCVDALPEDLQGVRDRAILLFGYYTAMRREELASMETSWLEFGTHGVIVSFPFSKTNQEGDIEEIEVPRREDAFCPVMALEAWAIAAGIKSGAVLRQFSNQRILLAEKSMTGYGIARVVKRAAKSVGLDQDAFAGHSLRRGFVTSMHRSGASVETIMETTRHSVSSTVRRYIERDELRRKIGESVAAPWRGNERKMPK